MKLGMPGYVRLLASLRDDPAPVSEFRERHGLSYCGSYYFIMGLYRLGRIHVSGWVLEHRKRPLAVFSYGAGVDAMPPDLTLSGKPSTGGRLPSRTNPSTSLVALEYALRTLEQPSTQDDLCEACGLDKATMRKTVKELVRCGFAHIKAWDTTIKNGPPRPVYIQGHGRTAPKPPKESRKAINARHWARRREAMRFEAIQRAFGGK